MPWTQMLRRHAAEIGIVGLAILVRLLAFTGPSQGDDFAYLEHAFDWAQGVFDPAKLDYVYGLRYGIILPVAGAMQLFGLSSASVVVPAFIASLLSVCSALIIGSTLGGRAIGLLAGLLVAVTPLSVLSGTLVLPESFLDASLWTMLALAVLGLSRKSAALLFAAGLVGGYAYLVRSYGLVLAPLGFAVLWGWHRPSARLVILFFAGLTLIPVTELLYHAATTGDPLWTFHLQRVVYSDLGNLNNSLLYYPRSLIRPSGQFGVFSILFLIAVIPAWRASPSGRFGVLWLALWFFFFEFALMSWNPPVPIHKEMRYLSVLILPGALVLAAALHSVWQRTPKLGWPAALLVLLAVGYGFRSIVVTSAALRSRMIKYQRLALEIEERNPVAVSFPHFRWPLRVNYFMRFSDGYRAYAPPRVPTRFRVPEAAATPQPGEWVVVHPGYFGPRGEWSLPHDPLPRWIEEPSDEWDHLLTVGGASVVVADRAPEVQAPAEKTEMEIPVAP